ncbi:hypothetical protein GGS23DRAFT_597226 [Durotheca rogersii]|uniref:uncharacterized protein n=1 Tax=Durotheca rogersii TaxID=419775 RepID=UPI00221FE9B6|nr:uncharacterized protein GGS23DRAFT_597226 [Durotheca rogersii]KAI5862922.1 hypothetical protein GGS23DRAFT_597226 [Durotheca rogersii]
MESLRFQLSDTQGALTEKTRQWRQLRVDHKAAQEAWAQEKGELEARIAQLETDNNRLRGANGGVDGGEKLQGPPGGDGGTVTITRARMRDAEAKYQKLTDDLAEKTRLSEALHQQLLRAGSGGGGDGDPGAALRRTLVPALTDDQAVARWKAVRDGVRALARRLSGGGGGSGSPGERLKQQQQLQTHDRVRLELEQLSAHWRDYHATARTRPYLLRALVWRYLHTCLFARPWRVWGRELGGAAAQVERALGTAGAEGEERRDWRARTAALLRRACEPDAQVLGDTARGIVEAAEQVAGAADRQRPELERAVADIVAAAAALAADLHRSRCLVLMSDRPGSRLTRGFPVREKTMEVRSRFGSGTAVDLMVSPCLLREDCDNDDYAVLVKAEVIC